MAHRYHPGLPPLRGRIETIEHQSSVLLGNALDDPHVRMLHLYLPPEHDAGGKRLPVVYFLTGFTGSGVMALNIEPWTPSVPQRLEALRDRGLAGPMILVFVDCFTRLGGSQYLNSLAIGRYEDYLIDEVVPLVDDRFRTIPDPAHRAILGKSSGGYGAIVQGMKHPETFGLICCHSGDMYFEYAYLPDFPKTVNTLVRHGGLQGFLEHFDSETKKSGDSVTALNILAMAACYSPAPMRVPPGFDLPFHETTGEIRQDVWERWLEHDPLRMLPKHEAALREARLLYLDAGIRDEWNLHLGARMFAERLRDRGIRHVHEEFDDGHMKITYRYERSLSLVSETFGLAAR